MTISEMKTLKVGDVIIDNEQTEQYNKLVLCKIYRVDKEYGIAVKNIEKEFDIAYPHRFHYKFDANKISFFEN